MSRDHDPLRDAFARARFVEPRDDEVAAVLARARGGGASRLRRAGFALLLAILIGSGSLLAVPAGREAAAAAFDTLSDFLEGGAAPGESLPTGEAADVLNWLRDARAGSPRVLAESGPQRLVAYREQGSEQACFSLGLRVTECGDSEYWRERFTDGVVLPLITTPTSAPDVVALWGITTDAVSGLELVYPDGRRLRPELGANGFVVMVDEGLVPEALVAIGQDGRVLTRSPVSDLQWRFSPGP